MILSVDKYSPEVCYADLKEWETVESAVPEAMEFAKVNHCTFIEFYRHPWKGEDCLDVRHVPAQRL